MQPRAEPRCSQSFLSLLREQRLGIGERQTRQWQVPCVRLASQAPNEAGKAFVGIYLFAPVREDEQQRSARNVSR